MQSVSDALLPSYPEQPELALVAAMTLMSRYACCRNPAVAEAAVAQLLAITSDARMSDRVRDSAAALLAFWQKQAGSQVALGMLH